MAWPPPLLPRLVAIAGRDEDAVSEAARRYGFERLVTDWRDLVADPESGSSTTAARTTCTRSRRSPRPRPASTSLREAARPRRRRVATRSGSASPRPGVVHMCAFNYRFVPAVRLARQLIEAGELGEIHHFRGRYLQEWGATDAEAWRFDKDAAGSGALGDLGAHVIDLARYLVGEIDTVSALTRDVQARPRGRRRLRGSRRVRERRGRHDRGDPLRHRPEERFSWEINGSKGSLAFDLERLNELQISDGQRRASARILVSEADHPFWSWWWPHGHMIGWEHTFVHEIHHLLDAIAGRPMPRTAPPSRTATAPRRSATRSSAPPRRARADGGVPIARRPVSPSDAGRGRPVGGRPQ